MRVATNSFSNALINHLQTLNRRQTTLQTQISSGQRVHDASDDPLAAQQILNLRDDSVATAQYAQNLQTHQDFAQSTSGALQSLQKILDRAQEISVSASGINSSDNLKSYGAEVSQLLQQAVQIANTQFRGDYIFSGTRTDVPAVTATTDANGNVQSVSFGGNSSAPQSAVAPGVTIASRLPAQNDTGSGTSGVFADSRSGADIFKHLIDLQNQLLSGTTGGISQETTNGLKADEDNLLANVAGNGALQSRIEALQSSNSDHKLAVESDLSKAADTDVTSAVVKLSQQQTAYQATLQSAATFMNISLLTYLQ